MSPKSGSTREAPVNCAMPELIRAIDWSATPLGPRAAWPAGLETALGIVLGAATPAALAWGADSVLLYNDAWAELIGEKHPDALGRPAREVFPELRDALGPVFAAALLPLRRADAVSEEAWFTYSFNPVPGPDGVEGVLVLAVETTQQGSAAARRRADEHLSGSVASGLSADFRALFEAAPTPYLVLSPDLVIVAANDAYLAATMTRREAVVGRRLFDVFPADPDEPEGDGVRNLRASLARVLATGQADAMPIQRYPIRKPPEAGGGFEERWWNPINVPVLDRDGRVGLVIHRVEDETARFRSQQALRESEERLRELADNVHQFVWTADASGWIYWYNKRWFDYTGTTLDEMQGWGWRAVHHPDHVDRVVEKIAAAFAGGEMWEDVFPLRGRDGTYRWFLSRARPIRDDKGAIVRWFGTNTDITEQRAAEEALRKVTETLEQEVALRTAERDNMWHLSQDMLGVFDLDGRLVSASPAWGRILGLAPEALVGRLHQELKHVDDGPGWSDVLARLRAGEAVRGHVARYRHADGCYRWISWTAKAEGECIYAVGRDVSDERERAAALEAAQEQLRQAQKMEAIGQLTGGVAHDFNNLLTIVGTAVAFLRRRELPDERRRRYVDAISQAVDRGAKLTSQLLAFARRQALAPEVFDARRRVQGVVDMLRTVLGSRIGIEIAVAEDVAFTVCADVSQFDTALVNMALNAKDAMDGEGVLSVHLARIEGLPGGGAGPYVAVSLTDTGRGIAPDAIDRIFEPFYTTKEVGRGTGLGLSQVFGFARQSKGDVRVRSRPGAGATFTLFLPQVEETPDERARPAAAALAASEGEGQRILVVEDNPEVGAFSSQILEDLGYRTVYVADARAALERLAGEGAGTGERERFDAVFSDVVMPGMSGLDLAREIERRHPGLPVVLTSGYSHVLAEGGAGDFELVRKPYSAEALSRALRAAAGRRGGHAGAKGG